MGRTKYQVSVRLITLVCLLSGLALAGSADHLTPLEDYTSAKGQGLGQKHAANLTNILDSIGSVYSSSALRPLSLQESMVGGAGFWKNPAKFGTDNRYMGVLYMAQKPQYIFGDDRNGHVASVLDKYGKTIIEVMTREIMKMNDPQVSGVVICIIWGNGVQGDPTQVGQEGMALFLSTSDLIQYKSFKLTIQSLVNRNDLFLFDGSQELENLTQFILEA